jgi:hypothetical protein
MTAETVLPPDLEALMASPEFQAQLALITRQAAAQLAALVDSLRAAEAALGNLPPPLPPGPPQPEGGIPDGLPWEPAVKIPSLDGYGPPEFMAPAVEPQTVAPATREAVAKFLASLAVEAPLSAVADLAPIAAALTETPVLAAASGSILATGALADALPGFDSFATWTGAEGTGV